MPKHGDYYKAPETPQVTPPEPTPEPAPKKGAPIWRKKK